MTLELHNTQRGAYRNDVVESKLASGRLPGPMVPFVLAPLRGRCSSKTDFSVDTVNFVVNNLKTVRLLLFTPQCYHSEACFILIILAILHEISVCDFNFLFVFVSVEIGKLYRLSEDLLRNGNIRGTCVYLFSINSCG